MFMRTEKKMEIFIIEGKSRKKNWCVFLTFFLSCFLLLVSHYSSLFSNGANSISPFRSISHHGLARNSREICNLFPTKESKEYLYRDEKKDRVEGVVINWPSKNSTENLQGAHDFDSCSGRYIYIHHLPSKFNTGIIKNCSSPIKWFDICKSAIKNNGFGPKVTDSGEVIQNRSWYTTDQFSLEVIFHNRMKQYRCLTNDSSLATAIYVPFYAGLDVGRYLWNSNTTARDAAALDFVKWVREQPEYKYMYGRDHFFVAGRISWDFRRHSDNDSDWGSNLMSLPESKNMTMLSIESSPRSNTDIAIPYPTYFHPSSENEVSDWQKKIQKQKREYLYSFVGAPRPNMQDSIRGKIINQCVASGKHCKLLDCGTSFSNCHDPIHVMKAFQSSNFCLQPPGDSATRRSTFDSILAGCIPVFFHPGTAYDQYIWHLPKNYSKYSVFIPENTIRDGKTNIEKILLGISAKRVLEMQEEVISLIPKILYADPSSRFEILEDAFDIAVKGVLERIRADRRNTMADQDS